MVFEKLRNHLKIPYLVNGYLSRRSTHEALKAQLYVLGFKLSCIPILEANLNDNKDKTRMDCLFVKNGNPVCGIEIDYSLNVKSIFKLLQLGSDVEKIIISYGRKAARRKAVYRHKGHLQDIKNYILYSEEE